jgi:predicted transcriptional regulator
MIKTIRKDNDFFITKIGKKLIETIKNIDDDVPEQ